MFDTKYFGILIASLVLLHNFVYVMNTSCIGKYQIPSNATNFNIFPRNMSKLNCVKFYIDPRKATLENNGQTIIIRYTYRNEIPIIENGPLGDEKYRFDFMYLNWLNAETLAGEDGKEVTVPIELHLVFTNTRFGNFARASTKNLGIVIMSFKHEIWDDSVEKRLYGAMVNTRNPYEKTTLEREIPPLFSAIAISSVYYVYLGKSAITQSLTGTCGPDVIWLDFPEKIEISPDEFQIFRDLLSNDGLPLMSKIDMSMPPNTTVFSSIDHFDYAENGWTAETFEGFGIALASSADVKKEKMFLLIIAVQIATRFFGIY